MHETRTELNLTELTVLVLVVVIFIYRERVVFNWREFYNSKRRELRTSGRFSFAWNGYIDKSTFRAQNQAQNWSLDSQFDCRTGEGWGQSLGPELDG